MIVPTGAMGNIAGGYMAKCMGVPIGTLTASVNINDTTHVAIQDGVFARTPTMHKTISEAINIQLPYNFERLLFYLTQGNHALVQRWYTELSNSNRIQLDKEWHAKLSTDFRSARVTDEDLCATLRKVHALSGYVADPHTGVALCAAERLGYIPLHNGNDGDHQNSRRSASDGSTQDRPTALMATASPCKFEEAVTVALGAKVWEEYRQSQFPQRACEILDSTEVAPIVYPFTAGKTLEEVQMDWQRQAEDIIDTL